MQIASQTLHLHNLKLSIFHYHSLKFVKMGWCPEKKSVMSILCEPSGGETYFRYKVFVLPVRISRAIVCNPVHIL